jgi:O-antigen biosynthesis protein
MACVLMVDVRGRLDFAAAFKGLAQADEPHVRALAAKSIALSRNGEADLALLAAERLCRIQRQPSADALALRAVMAQAAGRHEAASEDIAAALALQPRHGPANLAAMRFGDIAEQEAAALRVFRPGSSAQTLRQAADTLLAGGRDAVAAFRADPTVVSGLLVWRRSANAPALTVAFDDGSQSTPQFRANAKHAAGGAGRWAADIVIAWPERARTARVSGDALIAEMHLVRSSDGEDRDVGRPPAVAPAPPRCVAIIVPVFADAEATAACFGWLTGRNQDGAPSRIIAVDDCTPEPRIAQMLDSLAAAGDIALLRNDCNLGFAASVNRALGTVEPDEDVLLLNADAFLPPTALRRLQRAAYCAPDIGTVTPLSNNGEYTSVPVRFRENALPDAASVLQADSAASRANRGITVPLPNGIGFCLYVRRDALAAAGGLGLEFGRGYYEDVDFCLRLARQGFLSVAAADVYVGHAGAASFKAQKRLLVMDNLERLASLHPGYKAESAAFLRDDPLAEAAAQFEAVHLAEGPAFDLIIAPHGRTVGATGLLHGAGSRLAAASVEDDELALAFMEDGVGRGCLTLRYPLGAAAGAMAEDLKRLPIGKLVIVDPHLAPPQVGEAAERSGLPVEIVLGSCGVQCARAGLFDPHGLERPCCNGWCPLALSGAAALGTRAIDLSGLIRGAASISATTDDLAGLLGDIIPGIGSLPAAAQPAPVAPPPRQSSAGPPRLVIVAPSSGEPLLIHAVTSAVMKALPGCEIVILGDTGDDLRLMRDPGVFCVGPVGQAEWGAWMERLGGDALFVAGRWGIEGDPFAEVLRRSGWPMARFAWSARTSGPEGDDMLLRPDASAGETARRVASWAAIRLAPRGPHEVVDGKERTVVKAEPGHVDLGRRRIEVE